MLDLTKEGLLSLPKGSSRRSLGRTKAPLIGLTGSLASGKSTTLKVFKAQGFKVLSADDVVAEIYTKKRLSKDEIFRRFGTSASGLRRLERWIHPLVKERVLAFIKAHPKSPRIVEVPLLYEARFDRYFVASVYVFAPAKDRLKRAIARGMSRAMFESLDRRQLKASIKAERADFVLLNHSKASLQRQAKALAKILKCLWNV